MTAQGAQISGSTAGSDAARDWEAVRASGDIQFAPLPPMKPPERPDWLKWLDSFFEGIGKFLRDIFEPVGEAAGLSWPVLKWTLIVLAALGVLFIAWRLVEPLIGRPRKADAQEAPEWTPGEGAALALLEDADRLAAEGRFGEAAHLLLRRSVNHIAEARPDWLLPASTAREIASLPMLPERARQAFGAIAARVERSLFALRDLDAEDWKAARTAYADFALHRFGGAEAPA